MGWKSFRDRFQIKKHMLEVDGDKLIISSCGTACLAVVLMETGEVHPHPNHPKFLIENYPELVNTPELEILSILQQEDQFENSIPVYTYKGAEIIQKFCEIKGWPNLTHDGLPMYSNLYSLDKNRVVAAAKACNDVGIEMVTNQIERLKKELAESEEKLLEFQDNAEKLNREYPNIEPL